MTQGPNTTALLLVPATAVATEVPATAIFVHHLFFAATWERNISQRRQYKNSTFVLIVAYQTITLALQKRQNGVWRNPQFQTSNLIHYTIS